MTDPSRQLRETPGPGVLNRAREGARLTRGDLWMRYLGLGGMATPRDLDNFLDGSSLPPRREYNLIVDALNERMTDLDLDHPVRYT